MLWRSPHAASWPYNVCAHSLCDKCVFVCSVFSRVHFLVFAYVLECLQEACCAQSCIWRWLWRWVSVSKLLPQALVPDTVTNRILRSVVLYCHAQQTISMDSKKHKSKFCVNNWQLQLLHCHSRFSFKPHELPHFAAFRSIKHFAIHFHLFSLFPTRLVPFCFLILHAFQGDLTDNHCAKWACEKRKKGLADMGLILNDYIRIFLNCSKQIFPYIHVCVSNATESCTNRTNLSQIYKTKKKIRRKIKPEKMLAWKKPK